MSIGRMIMLIQKYFHSIKKMIEIGLIVIIATILIISALYLCKDNVPKVSTFETIQLTKFTKNGCIERMEWSRDKKHVAFVKSKKNGQGTINSLWIVNKNGGNERKIMEMDEKLWGGWGHTFHWSPCNRKIGFLVNSGGTIDTPELIKTIDVKTGKIEDLIPAEDGLGEFSWSPDGKKFVYWKGHEIWISSTDGKDRRKLVTTLRRAKEWVSTHLGGGENEIIGFEDAYNQPFVWSPDSTKFLLELRTFETSYVFQVDVLKGTFESLPYHPPKYPDIDRFSPQWSPNNKEILFVTCEKFYDVEDATKDTMNYAIWIFDVKTKSEKRLANNTGSSFSCSPDGKKIIYWKRKWEEKKGASIAINTDTVSHPPIPPPFLPLEEKELRVMFPNISKKEIKEREKNSREFVKIIKKNQLNLSPPILKPILNEPPTFRQKGNGYIMDIISRQIQKLPITVDANIESNNIIWVSEDTISYMKTLNETIHIFLTKSKMLK
jgi:Tol biopolymer transport system component